MRTKGEPMAGRKINWNRQTTKSKRATQGTEYKNVRRPKYLPQVEKMGPNATAQLKDMTRRYGEEKAQRIFWALVRRGDIKLER